MNLPLILLGKLVFYISRILKIGSGGTWPGEIALKLNPNIIRFFSVKLKKGVIIVAGTNGKTTTSLMIRNILQHQGYEVLHNDSGANLLNGIASAFIQQISWWGKLDRDWGVFEVDENSFPAVISNFSLDFSRDKQLVIVFLNLFRDQLDRYGEVDVIAEKWTNAIKMLPKEAKIILNSDDPQIAYLGKNIKQKVVYFGLNNTKLFLDGPEHATDSIFCLNCGNRLTYDGIYYSHIGIWKCEKCGEKRPNPQVSEWPSPLSGVYNRYNTLACVATALCLGIDSEKIKEAFTDFLPAFGRQEEIEIHGKKIKIFLSKNPAGFNESLRTILSQGAEEILFVLNDRIPDGRDVSWIWDVDFEMLPFYITPVVSGDRVYDLALRIKYSRQIHKLPENAVNLPQRPILIYEDLKKALDFCILSPKKEKTLFILATYSAMLEVRKILKGRKIL
ncbi:Mur ligase family protein [Candidatus Gottesmanbacteria bacterium]|nr:Mur ligase family protein [Candidatus Gottesmanbacteria bacterium]